jgi:hypothetical protein
MNRARPFVIDPSTEKRLSERASWYAPGLSDGLGDRLLMFDNTSATSLELLRLNPDLCKSSAFEAALRRRTEELESFQHPGFATVRTIESLGVGEGLAIVSNQTPGRRLSDVLQDARGPDLAAELIRQLAPSLAALHAFGDGIVHGTLAPERIVVTPEGHLVILEHVLGSAIAALSLPVTRLQAEFGLVLPPGEGPAAIDFRTDIAQVAFIALAIVVGRRLEPAEFPTDGELRILDTLTYADGRPRPRPSAGLRAWMARALLLVQPGFESMQAAADALAELPDLPAEVSWPGSPRTLQTFDQEADVAPAALKLAVGEPADAAIERSPADGRYGETGNLFEFPRVPAPHPAALPAPPAPLVSEAPIKAPRKRSARGQVILWAAAALALLAVGEGIVIGGLVRRRPPAPPPADPPATAALVAPPAQTGPGASGSSGSPASSPTPAASSGSPAPAPESAPRASGPATPAPTLAKLDIGSDPVGAKVTVDGVTHGVTPVVVQVSPGTHRVAVTDGTSTVTRTLTATAGGTASFVASLAPVGVRAGWLVVHSSLELQIREGGSILGVTSADRLMLPAGHHDLDLSNTAVGFRAPLSVDVPAGQTITESVSIPMGSISINALPWANVWIDGQPQAGTTPFASISLPLGPHEIIWRHPQLGERRQTVTVTLTGPVRLVMDLRK